MKIKTDSVKLQALFETLKESISKTGERPVLKYIKMEVKGNELTAVALDGYMLSTFKTTVENEDNEDFEFLIQPFYIPNTKIPSDVIFEKNKNVVNVTISQTTKDKLCYSFSSLPDVTSFIDWKKIMLETDKNLEVCFSASRMMRILRQFTKHNGLYNNDVVMSFERKNDGINPIAPIYLTQKTEVGVDKQAIILPVRRLKD